QRIEGPTALGLLAVDAVGDAGVADVPRGQAEPVLGVEVGIFGEVPQQVQPVVARAPRGVDRLVGYAGQVPVALQRARELRGAERVEVGLAPRAAGSLNRQPCA